MSDKIIFFCGPHTAGKTTILQRLKEENILQEIAPEIGKELYYKRKFITKAQNADFEIEVTEMELERDKKIFQGSSIVGVETWHPGNLAYATVRNPQIVDALAEKMKKSPLIDSAVGIYLDIPKDLIFQRTKTFQQDREWAADFYSKINSVLPQCFQKLGLSEKIIKIDATKNLEEVFEVVKIKISELVFQ